MAHWPKSRAIQRLRGAQCLKWKIEWLSTSSSKSEEEERLVTLDCRVVSNFGVKEDEPSTFLDQAEEEASTFLRIEGGEGLFFSEYWFPTYEHI